MRNLLLACLAALTFACGGNNPGTDGGDAGDAAGDAGDTTGGDAGIDAPPFEGECDPGNAQCSNCIDDDNDGNIDGFDIHCTGPLDNDESSFATGIPGDNIDAVDQDCFFDGNSGAGDDGCSIHVCCILGAPDVASCPIGANRYDVNACPAPLGSGTLSQKCIDTCGPLAPPGCDCFGCCTICDPANPSQCYDIATNPTTSPNCTVDTLADPTVCRPCTKNTQCGNGECGGTSCILCPGQDPSTLPDTCGGTNECPNGGVTCSETNQTCAEGAYCSNGCCIGVLQ